MPNLEVDDLLNEEKRQELIIALNQRIKKKEDLREVIINQSMINLKYLICEFMTNYIVISVQQVIIYDHNWCS